MSYKLDILDLQYLLENAPVAITTQFFVFINTIDQELAKNYDQKKKKIQKNVQIHRLYFFLKPLENLCYNVLYRAFINNFFFLKRLITKVGSIDINLKSIKMIK